ncbi:MAG: 30S ribosomal protein S2 [Elusimicrobia bacterium HGW-Elusimicrobia-1]|nr:MAG: 30S ribosomal protein S2 [Elusimicrobia bacterium HGW-Elusimicrobia-1]
MVANFSMKSLLEAGVHFGHQTRRWNPKMAKYIFGARKLTGGKETIHIIDLQKTVKELKKALKFVKDSVAAGSSVLFVGTKKQAAPVVKEEAAKCQSFYVVERWLGGTLTNFETLKKSLDKFGDLHRMKTGGVLDKLSKKEASRKNKELARFEKYLDGIKEMKELPGVVFIVDPHEEATAVAECRRLGIPTVAVCDTNTDPELIDYPIPGNDDAIRAIQLFCQLVSSAVLEGRELAQKAASAASSDANAGSAETAESYVPQIPEDEMNKEISL